MFWRVLQRRRKRALVIQRLQSGNGIDQGTPPLLTNVLVQGHQMQHGRCVIHRRQVIVEAFQKWLELLLVERLLESQRVKALQLLAGSCLEKFGQRVWFVCKVHARAQSPHTAATCLQQFLQWVWFVSKCALSPQPALAQLPLSFLDVLFVIFAIVCLTLQPEVGDRAGSRCRCDHATDNDHAPPR